MRDAHEKKRQIVHTRRLQLPRWQKIQQNCAEVFGREGVSTTVTATNIAETPAPSQDSVEIDTHKGVVVSVCFLILCGAVYEAHGLLSGLCLKPLLYSDLCFGIVQSTVS